MEHIQAGRPERDPSETCPFCKAKISPRDEECPECGEELFEEPRPRPRRRRPELRRKQDGAVEFLVPVNVSGWGLAAGYLGLFSCVPFIGLVFAIPAIVCGILALNKQKHASSYGEVTSSIRAVIGLILGVLGLLVWGFALVMVLTKK